MTDMSAAEARPVPIDWDSALYADVPAKWRPAVEAYETAVCGIPDCFDSLTPHAIHELALYALELDLERVERRTVTAEADKFVRAHLDMLETWRDAIDALDSDLRGDTIAGGLPEWASTFLKAQARALFHATNDLLRAAVEFHHGSAGPRLNPDYGDAYALSNSVLSPF